MENGYGSTVPLAATQVTEAENLNTYSLTGFGSNTTAVSDIDVRVAAPADDPMDIDVQEDHSAVCTLSDMPGAPVSWLTLMDGNVTEYLRDHSSVRIPWSMPGAHGPPIPLLPVAVTTEDDIRRFMQFLKEKERNQMQHFIPLFGMQQFISFGLPVVKVETGVEVLKFKLPNLTMDDLKRQVLKRKSTSLTAADVLKFMYKDEDGEMITITCDEDLNFCSQYFKSSLQTTSIRLSLVVNDNH